MAYATTTRPFTPDRISLERPLSGPCLEFDLEADLARLHAEDTWRRNGHNARTLAKYPDTRIVLGCARAGTRMSAHEPNERLTVQCLSGHVRVYAGGKAVDLRAGHLAVADKAMAHDIEAVKDSSFLLSVSWPTGA